MVNLAFYSDQIIPENAEIDRRLLALMAANGLGNRIGYIPSGPEPDRRFFAGCRRYYDRYGLDLCLFYDLDEMYGGDERQALFACDAIHLSGGHTGGFLRRLRRSGMLPLLRRWALDGGMLIGASAGAILMTPTIATDALFAGQAPEDLIEETALDLVPFEFFPHLGGRPTYLAELLRYSRHTSRPIVACADGNGLLVSGGRVTCIGPSIWIVDGTIQQMKDVRLRDLLIAPS